MSVAQASASVCRHLRGQYAIAVSRYESVSRRFTVDDDAFCTQCRNCPSACPQLRPRYLVLPAERLVTETPESVAITPTDIYPDVSVPEARSVTATTQGGAIAAAPLEMATIIPTPVPHVTIEIRDTAKRQLVTAITVLSFVTTMPSRTASARRDCAATKVSRDISGSCGPASPTSTARSCGDTSSV